MQKSQMPKQGQKPKMVENKHPMRLLDIQSSARQDGSISRMLSDEFMTMRKEAHPGIEHKRRDVGAHTPEPPNALWTTANYTLPEDRSPDMIAVLAQSETLIKELFWADYVLLGVPMYNFSVPSTLKAYIDNVVRINRTFEFFPEDNSFQGLVRGKRALIITPSAGNFAVGTPMGSMNFCDPYLRMVFGFIGIDDVTVVPVPNQFLAGDARQRAIDLARAELMKSAQTW